MGLEEVDREVEPREKKKFEGMKVKPRTYTKIIKEFIESDMEKARVTVDDEYLTEGTEEVPARTLDTGLRNNNLVEETPGVKVVKDGDDIFLVKTDEFKKEE